MFKQPSKAFESCNLELRRELSMQGERGRGLPHLPLLADSILCHDVRPRMIKMDLCASFKYLQTGYPKAGRCSRGHGEGKAADEV